MSVRDVREAAAMRRVLESMIASVSAGLLLWWLTSPSPQSMSAAPTPTPAESMPSPQLALAAVQPPIDKEPPSAAAISADSGPLFSETYTYVPASMESKLLTPPAPIASVAAASPSKIAEAFSIPLGSVLLHENFSRYREGDATGWGPNTLVKIGPDRRKWLTPAIEGICPIACKIRLPREFYLEFRYAIDMSDVTRGLLGWWRQPMVSKVSFWNRQGTKYTIEWTIGCGNDPTRLNALGSASLCAKTYFHTIKLPGGAVQEVGVLQPTGTVRIVRDPSMIRVSLDNQAATAAPFGPADEWVGFEVDAVKDKNGTVSFTDLKIGR